MKQYHAIHNDSSRNWQTLEFEKCLKKVIYTNKIHRKNFKKEGQYPIISQEKEFINGYWNEEKDLFKVDKPVVIFGDHTQVIKYIDFDFVLGADGVKILQPQNNIDTKYFYYYLQNIDLGTLGYARHYKLLKEINVMYPPLPEQKRIVTILDQAFEAIKKAKENTEQNLKNAKEIFESYLQGVFENKGDDWEEKKLGEVCEIELGKTPYRGDKSLWDIEKKTQNVWLSIADLLNTDSKFIYDSKEYVADKAIRGFKVVQKGTLLVSFKLTLGRLAFAGRDLFTNEAIAALSIKDEHILDKYFLYQVLSFFDWHKAAEGDVKVKGKTLNKAKLKEIPIPLPPLPEQQNIVRQLDALRAETQKLEAIYTQKLSDLEELKKSLLQKAFAGEL
jgi:type I restriction enzyme S subunit